MDKTRNLKSYVGRCTSFSNAKKVISPSRPPLNWPWGFFISTLQCLSSGRGYHNRLDAMTLRHAGYDACFATPKARQLKRFKLSASPIVAMRLRCRRSCPNAAAMSLHSGRGGPVAVRHILVSDLRLSILKAKG